MNLNFKKAFFAPFSDKRWFLKIIFPSFIALTGILAKPLYQESKPLFFLLLLISIIPSLIYSGFALQFAHNEIHDIKPLLPNLKSNLIKYIKYGWINLGFGLIYIVLSLIIILIGIILGGMIGGVIMFLLQIIHLKALGNILFWTILIISLIAAFIFSMILTECAWNSYSDKFSFNDAVNVERNFNLLSKVKFEIFITIITLASLSLLGELTQFVLSITVIGVILIPTAIAAIQLTGYNLTAQTYKIAKIRVGEYKFAQEENHSVDENIDNNTKTANADILEEPNKSNKKISKTKIIIIAVISLITLFIVTGGIYLAVIFSFFTPTGTLKSNMILCHGFINDVVGNDQEAFNDFSKVIKIDPKNSIAYQSRADIKAQKEDYTGAIQDYNKALKLWPDYIYAYKMRAVAKSAIGDYKGAINDYSKALELSPDSEYIYSLRGTIKERIGDYQGAISDLEKAVKYDPKDQEAQSLLNKLKSNKHIIRKPSQPDFGPYMKNLQKQIKENWTPPKGNESKKIVVLFKVDRKGDLLNTKVQKSSGIKKADEAAILAIKATAPFEPLPNDYKSKDIDIQFTFDYNVFNQKK